MMGLDFREQLTKYLTDAHSIEEQSLQQMKTAPDIAGEAGLEQAFREHRAETESHERRVRTLLEARDVSPSRTNPAVGVRRGYGGRLPMRIGALGWGSFFLGHPDTPGKLAGFAYAFEHLEIGGYEQLRRVAQRAGDPDTVRVAEQILAQERATADELAGAFDEAVSAALAAQSD